MTSHRTLTACWTKVLSGSTILAWMKAQEAFPTVCCSLWCSLTAAAFALSLPSKCLVLNNEVPRAGSTVYITLAVKSPFQSCQEDLIVFCSFHYLFYFCPRSKLKLTWVSLEGQKMQLNCSMIVVFFLLHSRRTSSPPRALLTAGLTFSRQNQIQWE